MSSSAGSPPPRLLFTTTYDPRNQSAGGAAWVDTALLAALADFPKSTFFVCDASSNGVPLEIRGSRRAQARTLLRILTRGEPYQTAKFRFSSSWAKRANDLRLAAEEVQSIGGQVVTSQWPALLLAQDAGVAVDIHVAHNVDTIIAERFDPLPLRLLRNSERMRRAESKLLAHPSRIFALSLTDAERIREMGHDCHHLSLAPARTFTSAGRAINGRVIGFIGKMSWPPNASAFENLLSIVARVNSEVPDIDRYRVVVAGRGSENIPSSATVTSLGPVSDLNDFYSTIDLVVVPRSGDTTGVSVKLLEAVSRGVKAIAPKDLIVDAALNEGVIPADDDEAIYRHLLGEQIRTQVPGPSDDAINLTQFSRLLAPVTGQAQ